MGEIDTKACKGCFHLGETAHFPSCDYILNTGHRRPCPAGKGCTVKQIGSGETGQTYREVERRTVTFTRKWDTELGLKLYLEGKSDREIAQAVGATAEAVRNWRRKMGLEPNYTGRPGEGGETAPREQRRIIS